jgi:hypothetical protein
MARELQVPADLGPSKAGEWFRAWGAEARSRELRLVLPDASALGPTARVLLAAGLAARAREGLGTELRGPEEARQALAGLRPVSDLRAAREQADERARELERELEGVAPSPLRMARFVFEELGANVVQHSGAPATGFGQLQAHPGTRSIELAFADAGAGFLASLQRNPEFAGRIQEEGEALQLALGKGVSGTGAPRRNMGIGLGLLQDFADRVGGELWIASGSALLRRRAAAGVPTNTVHAVPAWPGSWICLQARLG